MNKDNASKLWKMIQEAGDYLKNKLPHSSNHPKGRNPYACLVIKIDLVLIQSNFNDETANILPTFSSENKMFSCLT